MSSCEYCEIYKNTFLYRTPSVAASWGNRKSVCQRSSANFTSNKETSFKKHRTCLIIYRICRKSSVKKLLSEISQKSHENTCARVSFLTKLQTSIIKQTLAQVFFCEFCKSSRNTSSYRTRPEDASEIYLWTLAQTYKKCIFYYDMNVHQNS